MGSGGDRKWKMKDERWQPGKALIRSFYLIFAGAGVGLGVALTGLLMLASGS